MTAVSLFSNILKAAGPSGRRLQTGSADTGGAVLQNAGEAWAGALNRLFISSTFRPSR